MDENLQELSICFRKTVRNFFYKRICSFLDGEVLKNFQIPGFEDIMKISETWPPITDANSVFRLILGKLKADEKNAWPFLEPVDPDEVPEYYDHISFPIDLKTIGERIKKGYYIHVYFFYTFFKFFLDIKNFFYLKGKAVYLLLCNCL